MRKFLACLFFLVPLSCSSAGTEMKENENDDYIGVATMLDDGTIVLHLRADADGGASGQAMFEYKPDDPEYSNVKAHIGAIKAGEEVYVRPWDD